MNNAAYNMANFEATQPRLRVVKGNGKSNAEKEELNKFMRNVVVLAVAIVMLAVYTVYSNMLLTKTKAQITKQSAALTELQSENVYLDYKIESMVSYNTVADYAENELGLIKLSSAQIEYVNLENENVIIEHEDTVNVKATMATILDTVADMICF